MPKKKKKYMTGTCQCEEPAIPRPPSILRKVQCPRCGKTFHTSRDIDLCFSCEKVS